MRIGSLTSVNINQWTPTYQRTTIQKQVPGFIVAQTYDIVARNNVLQIQGYLVGSSTSNLATQATTLRGYANQKKVVWIDASDQYLGYCELVRIIEIDGPNLNIQNNGVLTADFTIKAQMLLPWGTTFSNPFRQTGIVLRDLNGVGMEYMLNPLEFNCNFQLNEIGVSDPYSFSWEFIVDNQNPFTNATSVQECTCTALGSGTASATNPIATNGVLAGLTAFGTMTIDSTVSVENLGASLKGYKNTPANSGNYSMSYNFGTAGINLTAYDRLRAWFRCDQTGQTTYALLIQDTSGNQRWWTFSLQGASTWMNIEVAIASYTNQNAGFSISAVQYIGVWLQMSGSAPASINVWIDDIRAEIGYINHCEDTSGWQLDLDTATNDTVIYKQYNPNGTPDGVPASVHEVTAAGGGGNAGDWYVMPCGSINISNYDFLLIWARSDFGGNSTGNMEVLCGSNTSAFYQWNYNGLNANQWYRFVAPLRNPAHTTGSPNSAAINSFLVLSNGAPSTNHNLWVDEIAVDIGNPTVLEFMVPDNITQGNKDALRAYTYQSATYYATIAMDTSGTVYDSAIATTYYFLDGEAANAVYSNTPNGAWQPNTIGSTPIESSIFNNISETITYTTVWGTNNRWAFALKLPPATSDSLAGNYPSDDLSGPMAINKVRIKVQVYVSNDDTTYVGL